MNKEAQAMIEAIQQNELEAAVQLFKQSVEQSVLENNSADLAELAETMHALGFLSEAKEAYGALNYLAPQIQEWNIALAEIAIDEDDYDQALDILLTIDKESDVYPQALLTMADAYQVQGLYEVSEKKIFEAMALLPDEPILDYALAQLYHSIGEYKKAIPIYEELAFGNWEIASATQLHFSWAIVTMLSANSKRRSSTWSAYRLMNIFRTAISNSASLISNSRNTRVPSAFLINCSKRIMLT